MIHESQMILADTISETKVLKQRVRDHLDPTRDLGHSDRHGKQGKAKADEAAANVQSSSTGKSSTAAKEEEAPKPLNEGGQVKRNPDGTVCDDCR